MGVADGSVVVLLGSPARTDRVAFAEAISRTLREKTRAAEVHGCVGSRVGGFNARRAWSGQARSNQGDHILLSATDAKRVWWRCSMTRLKLQFANYVYTGKTNHRDNYNQNCTIRVSKIYLNLMTHSSSWRNQACPAGLASPQTHCKIGLRFESEGHQYPLPLQPWVSVNSQGCLGMKRLKRLVP